MKKRGKSKKKVTAKAKKGRGKMARGMSAMMVPSPMMGGFGKGGPGVA